MPIYFRNTSHDIMIGKSPIEKMGGDKLTYSMYGDNIPVVPNFNTETLVDFQSTYDTTFYLLSNGELWGCGDNGFGQMGEPGYIEIGDPMSENWEFIDNSRKSNIELRATNVKSFFTDPGLTLYIDNNNDLYSSTLNTTDFYDSFRKIASNVKKAEGVSYSVICYLDFDGNLYGCGYNSRGQLGLGHKNEINSFVKIASNVIDFQVNNSNVCYIDVNDNLYMAGYCPGKTVAPWSTTFTKCGSNVKKAYIQNHYYYLTKDNKLFAYGTNSNGQLGTGDTNIPNTFVQIATNVKDIYTGRSSSYSTIYIDNNDDLYFAGDGNNGQRGDGITTDSYTFMKIASNVKQAESTINMTCYVDKDNNLYVTGKNNYGQLGLSHRNQVNTFTKVAENVDFCQVSHSTLWYKALAVGSLFGAGNNETGQQGLGDTRNVENATYIPYASEFVEHKY